MHESTSIRGFLAKTGKGTRLNSVSGTVLLTERAEDQRWVRLHCWKRGFTAGRLAGPCGGRGLPRGFSRVFRQQAHLAALRDAGGDVFALGCVGLAAGMLLLLRAGMSRLISIGSRDSPNDQRLRVGAGSSTIGSRPNG